MNRIRLLFAGLVALGLLTACGGGGSAALKPSKVRTREVDGAEMIWVPGGAFTIGLDEADVDAVMAECSYCRRDRVDNACPQHTVQLDGFWIDRREVTNDQYRRCVEAGACTPPSHTDAYDDPAHGDEPVTAITLHWLYPYDATDGREDPDVPRMRAIRGAAWAFDPDVERCAFRFYSPQEIFSDQLGLRVALSPSP